MQGYKKHNDNGITTKHHTFFYHKDKFNHLGLFVKHQFMDPFHFLYNLVDLFAYPPDLIRVYLGRTVSPGIREMVILTVASTNGCIA